MDTSQFSEWQDQSRQDPPPLLCDGEVHCWIFSAPIEISAAYLTEADFERARNYSPRRRQLFLAGRASLRYLLRLYLGEKGSLTDIALMDNGKPFLANLSELHFSLSHIDKELVIAMSNTAVGIDIESALRRLSSSSMNRIASRLFAGKQTFASQQDFLTHWTIFEASQKLHGHGVFGQRYQARQCLTFTTPAGNVGTVATDMHQPAGMQFFHAVARD